MRGRLGWACRRADGLLKHLLFRGRGRRYDFSQIQPSDGNSYFSGPDANNEYMYYFQMTGGGLPADDGAMPYCTFGAGMANGNSVGDCRSVARDENATVGRAASTPSLARAHCALILSSPRHPPTLPGWAR